MNVTMAENTEKHENSNFGNAYNISGGLQEAIDYNERSLMISVEIGEKKNEGKVYDNTGEKNAIDHYERDLKIAKEVGDKEGEGAAYCNLGVAYGSLGDFQKAMEYNERYLKI